MFIRFHLLFISCKYVLYFLSYDILKFYGLNFIIEIVKARLWICEHSEKGRLHAECLLPCSPACLILTKKFSVWVYWKLFCHFWYCRLYFFLWIPHGYPLNRSVKDFLSSHGGGEYNSILLHFGKLQQCVFFLCQSLDVRASENLSAS